MNEISDEFQRTHSSLVNRLKNWDDQDSWRVFLDTYWKLIYSAARKAGLTPEEAEDVVQETLVTVMKKIKDLQYDPALGSFKGWLLNTTRWRIADHFRNRHPEDLTRKRASGGERGTATVERIPDPAEFDLDRVWEEDWRKNLADAAMERVKRKVNPQQYQIFDLYVVKQLPVAEVAKLLGISSAQVYLAKHRVLRLVQKEVQELERNPV